MLPVVKFCGDFEKNRLHSKRTLRLRVPELEFSLKEPPRAARVMPPDKLHPGGLTAGSILFLPRKSNRRTLKFSPASAFIPERPMPSSAKQEFPLARAQSKSFR